MARSLPRISIPLLLMVVIACVGCPNNPPVAAFSATPTSGNAPLQVTFTDHSTAGSASITVWAWDFGDGYTGSAHNPVHTYATPGTYAVSLTVTSAHGSDKETKNNLIHVTEPGGPQVEPTSGAPGTMVKITIPGNILDANTPMNNRVFFGDTEMVPSNVTSQEVTTAVPPLASAGTVPLRVEVSSATVVTGFNFEILAPPPLTAPPGAVATDVENTLVDMVATTLNVIKPMLDSMGAKEAGQMREALDAFDMQINAIQPLMDYAKEHDELELLDQVLVSSGFANEVRNIQEELTKRLALAGEMDALEKAILDRDPTKAAQNRFLPARQRFILDWLSARFHLAMEFANVAMVALNTAASFAPVTGLYTFGGAVAVGNVFMAMLNMMYIMVEASPVDLVPDSLTGKVGENNAVATNSSALVVFKGTFIAEKNSDQVVWALFFPGFSGALGLPSILANVLQKIGNALLATAEHPDEHRYIIPPLPPDPDMPIYAFEFMEGLSANPPQFDAGGLATLNVAESRVYAGDQEGGPFDLIAKQKVYRFKGGFFMPADPPHIEKEEATCTSPVEIKRGLTLNLNEPLGPDPLPPLGDPVRYTISGHVENWDGSPVDDSRVTITIEAGGTTVTITPTGGDFTEEVTVPPGTTTVTVTGDDGETTASDYVMVINAALPATYCVVTNVSGDSLSLIDLANNMEFQRVKTTDVENVLDGTRDAAFLPDGETLIVLNSALGSTANVVALRLPNLVEIAPLSPPLMLGDGKSWAVALSPNKKTALVTCNSSASALYVIDVREPDTLRLVNTIDFTPYDDYGTANLCTAVAPDGRSVALVTTGNYQSGGPSNLVVLDITNPYSASVLGTVQVASRGAAVAPVPGHACAVVSGTSLYNTATQKVDGAIDVVDFADPEHPEVRGKLVMKGAFLFGVAVMPDGETALVTDVGNPLSPSNRLLSFDISNPDLIVERTAVSPLPFGGTGSPRIGLSPDGHYAVAPNNVSNSVVVFDLTDPDAPTTGDPIDVDALPFGVVFRPALP